jgi:hypothetical protein
MFASSASANRRHRRACLGRTKTSARREVTIASANRRQRRLFGHVDRLRVKNIQCRRQVKARRDTKKGIWRVYQKRYVAHILIPVSDSKLTCLFNFDQGVCGFARRRPLPPHRDNGCLRVRSQTSCPSSTRMGVCGCARRRPVLSQHDDGCLRVSPQTSSPSTTTGVCGCSCRRPLPPQYDATCSASSTLPYQLSSTVHNRPSLLDRF